MGGVWIGVDDLDADTNPSRDGDLGVNRASYEEDLTRAARWAGQRRQLNAAGSEGKDAAGYPVATQIVPFGRYGRSPAGGRHAAHIGGYRSSSGTQRKLQSVTGVRRLRTPDRRLGA